MDLEKAQDLLFCPKMCKALATTAPQGDAPTLLGPCSQIRVSLVPAHSPNVVTQRQHAPSHIHLSAV